MSSGFSRLSLTARVMGGAVVFIVLAATGAGYFIFNSQRSMYLADRASLSANRAERSVLQIRSTIDALHRDILFLSQTPPVQGILRAARNQGLDARDGISLEAWSKRLQEIFSAFIGARPDYFQVRFIGVADNGRELARAEIQDGKPQVASPDKLQRKGDRDYFQAALKLKAGEVFLSEINLNREHGQIQVPHVRTLRAVTPVFAREGDLFGMVAINLDVGSLFDFATTHLPPGVQAYIVNGDGDYLAHPDPRRTFGFDLGQRHTWQQDLPTLRIPSAPGRAERQSLQAVPTAAGDLLHITVERLNFDPQRPDRFLALAYALPDSFVRARLADARNATLAVTAAIVLALLGVVLLLVRRAFAPLTQLTALARTIGAGHYDVALPSEGVGEMQSFIQAFHAMSEGIRERERETKEALALLQQSEARLRTVVENLSEGVAAADLEGRLLSFNRAALDMHGFTGTDEYLRHLPEFAETFELASLDGTVWPVEQWPLARILRGETLRDLETRIRRTGTDWQRIFCYGGALARDPDGQPLMAVVTIRDVTERKQTEEKIRAQLEHLKLLDHITRAIAERLDLKSVYQVVVRTLEDSLPTDFGCICHYEQPPGRLKVTSVGAKSGTLARMLTLEEQATIDVDENGLSRCVHGQLVYEPDIAGGQFPFLQRLSRGGLRSVVMAPIRSESGVSGVLVAARREPRGFSSANCEFLRQVSEHVGLAVHQVRLYEALQQAYEDLRRTQEAVIQQERLNALGQMASGIAHDINNALSPVSVYTEFLLEKEANLSERARRYLKTIRRAVEDMTQTVGRMREFYRQREPQLMLAPVDLNQLAQQVMDLTHARWSDMPQQRGIVIRAVKELAPDLPRIVGVESEIREALTNLVFNAVDAMPEGGTLTLRTKVSNGPGRATVAIEVSDQGVGMDEETRRRCVEPFFTTKGQRGTGLGLAMVLGMVQRHSAELEIDSAPGAGTTMRLLFSVPEALPAERGQPVEPLEVPSRLRLLLVDDDPTLLKSLREALEADGHVILTANGGEEGLTAFRASLIGGEAFDAVITDLGMPYVDGRKVASSVKEASPAMPVILLTGWGARLVADGDIPPHVDRVLAKPPKLREVRAALAQLCRRIPD